MRMRYSISLGLMGTILWACAAAAAQQAEPRSQKREGGDVRPATPQNPVRSRAGRVPLDRAAVRDGGAPATTQPATTQPTAGPAPRLVLKPTVFDFGEVWEGMPAKQEFTIKNAGDAPLNLSAKSSCGCTVASRPKSPLAPNETTTFTVEYKTSHVGKAHKTVTLMTNDPGQRNVKIDVKGVVKPLYKATPGKRIVFRDLEPGSKENVTVKLENKFEKPLMLKLKEGQTFGNFDVELREVKPGEAYELSVTTKPPLRVGWNRAIVKLATGLDVVPEISIPVHGNAQPRVFVSPFTLTVTPNDKEPSEKLLRVQYRTSSPVKITKVRSSLESVRCEVQPSTAPTGLSKTAYHQIRVLLPPYDEIPEDGGLVEIFTDDKDEEYQRLEVPIVRRDLGRRQARPVTKAPGDVREALRRKLEEAQQKKGQ